MNTKVLDLIRDNPIQIGHWLGFNDLKEIHNEWMQKMFFGVDDETLLAHRNSYKTTCLTIVLACNIGVRPNKNTILLRKTDDDVKEVVAQTSKILKTEVMQHLLSKLYGHGYEMLEDTAFRISTNLPTANTGAAQLLGLGCKSSITGKHADWVITDDIVNIRDRISRPERELVKLSYKELLNVKKRGGHIFNTGTPWHKDDAIAAMPNVTRCDCYSTGLMTRDEIENLRQDLGNSLFASNYELKHIADEDTMFSEPTFEADRERIYQGTCHIDAAYGGKDDTAFSAINIIDERLVVLGKLWPKHVDDCLDEIMDIREIYRLGSISCEENADKGYLVKELKRKRCPAKGYHESMNKFVKISTYLRKAWGDIDFLEETDPEYINQILDYNENAAHDDAPDSLASLIRQRQNVKKWLY